MKGKGELYVRPTSYQQDGDAKRGLPDIIQSTVNNGVDPSLIPLEGEEEQELVEGRADGGEVRDDDVGEYIDSGNAVSERDQSGEVGQYGEYIADEPASEPDPAMDSLVESMNRMRAGPHDDRDHGNGSVDERGVPVDYTAGNCELDEQEQRSHPQQGMKRDDIVA